MKQYLDEMQYILDNGTARPDRTGTGTLAVFGRQMRFDLSKGFPAVTTKKLAWKAMVSELLWFLEGSGDEKRLREILHGNRDSEKPTIWTDNANAPYWKDKAKFEGDLGRVYGQQWVGWQKPARTGLMGIWDAIRGKRERVNQVEQLIQGIKSDPYGRRHILSAWNPGELDQMALPPCHTLSQFFVADGKLSCQMYQRSADFGLGIPFNIASYSLLTHMIAHVCGLHVGEFVHVIGDAHIYNDHIDAVKEQLTRTPYELPTLWINPEITNINDFTMDDFNLNWYKHHKSIKMEMAV